MPLSPIVQALLASSQNQGMMTPGSGLMSLGRSIGTAIAQYKHNKKMEESAEKAVLRSAYMMSLSSTWTKF